MEQTSEEVRKLRELKLERILLYTKWKNRPPEELHYDWKQWMLLRKLRRENQKPELNTNTSNFEEHEDDYIITSFDVKINQSYLSNQEFVEYVDRVEREFRELQKIDTWTLLRNYKNRYHNYEWDEYDSLSIDDVKYLQSSVKYVLNTREHITTKKDKIKLSGKKDKKHGRKNPTKRK